MAKPNREGQKIIYQEMADIFREFNEKMRNKKLKAASLSLCNEDKQEKIVLTRKTPI